MIGDPSPKNTVLYYLDIKIQIRSTDFREQHFAQSDGKIYRLIQKKFVLNSSIDFYNFTQLPIYEEIISFLLLKRDCLPSQMKNENN